MTGILALFIFFPNFLKVRDWNKSCPSKESLPNVVKRLLSSR